MAAVASSMSMLALTLRLAWLWLRLWLRLWFWLWLMALAAAVLLAGAPMEPKAWAACQSAEVALSRWECRLCCCSSSCFSLSPTLCCDADRRWPRKCIFSGQGKWP